jgi:hypothetical protein
MVDIGMNRNCVIVLLFERASAQYESTRNKLGRVAANPLGWERHGFSRAAGNHDQCGL